MVCILHASGLFFFFFFSHFIIFKGYCWVHTSETRFHKDKITSWVWRRREFDAQTRLQATEEPQVFSDSGIQQQKKIHVGLIRFYNLNKLHYLVKWSSSNSRNFTFSSPFSSQVHGMILGWCNCKTSPSSWRCMTQLESTSKRGEFVGFFDGKK